MHARVCSACDWLAFQCTCSVGNPHWLLNVSISSTSSSRASLSLRWGSSLSVGLSVSGELPDQVRWGKAKLKTRHVNAKSSVSGAMGTFQRELAATDGGFALPCAKIRIHRTRVFSSPRACCLAENANFCGAWFLLHGRRSGALHLCCVNFTQKGIIASEEH